MRDLLSKLDSIISETELKDKEDLQAKRKALQDIQLDPNTHKDSELSSELARRKASLEKEAKDKNIGESMYEIGDDFGISFSEDFEIATEIVDIYEDGIVINLDDAAMAMMSEHGIQFIDARIDEEKQKGLDGKACWKGYKRMGTKMKGGKRVDNCVKVGEDRDIDEAKYQGREVPLGKPMSGDVKKSKVYVRGPKGNVVKVNFGDKKMKIKKSNPKRRKSFRARHNCSNPGPRHKARYWSCRAW
jgi:predicted hydrocarbon binding protein